MSERIDDITVNAENADRTFAELLVGLQREGIVHPLQAQRLEALLTRSAGELRRSAPSCGPAWTSSRSRAC